MEKLKVSLICLAAVGMLAFGAWGSYDGFRMQAEMAIEGQAVAFN